MEYKIRFFYEPVPAGFKPEGALKECFNFYPHLHYDFKTLVRNGIIKIISPEKCKWLKSIASLAQYIKWADGDAGRVTGGFWAPIEKAFGIDRQKLSKAASKYSDPYNYKESKDFKDIKKCVNWIRGYEDFMFETLKIFKYLKYMINEKANERDFESIVNVIITISERLYGMKLVDKNFSTQLSKVKDLL